jgi:signal peptidase I
MIFDFSALLVLLTIVSGLIWALDAWILAPGRREALAVEGLEAESAEDQTPVLVDYARSFFPVFLIVLLLRSFLIEPFRIPSDSMMPTLLTGDFILVNKYNYGIRLPVVNSKVIEIGAPDYGDIAVFRYPEKPDIPFIKRIVGLPGDRITYRDKTLFVNGEAIPRVEVGRYEAGGAGRSMHGAQLYTEDLFGVEHDILIDHTRSDFTQSAFRVDQEVPAGHYFVMGDNRDHSSDSRMWGFVPDENLIGRAFLIWLHWDAGVDFSRVGSIYR